MERTVELVAGVGAGVLGLTGVVAEAQALSNPVENPSPSYLLGSNAPGAWAAAQGTQHALLPMALVFLLLAFGAYFHAIREQSAGLAMLVSSSAVVLFVIGVAVFQPTYTAVLFIPAPLVVLTALLAAAASVSALSGSPWPEAVSGIRGLRLHRSARTD